MLTMLPQQSISCLQAEPEAGSQHSATSWLVCSGAESSDGEERQAFRSFLDVLLAFTLNQVLLLGEHSSLVSLCLCLCISVKSGGRLKLRLYSCVDSERVPHVGINSSANSAP